MNWNAKSIPASREIEVTDETLFPFGKHKDEKLIDVPASYLAWFNEQTWSKEWPALKRYVKKNWKAIEQDLDDEEDWNDADYGDIEY